MRYGVITKKSKHKNSIYETLQYIIVFLALAGGLVHLSIYVDHTPLRMEYGIFLLLAAISQIEFGVLLLSKLFNLTLLQKEFRYLHHRHLTINLFGLIGSILLLVLYIYVVNFPSPPFT